MAADAARVAGVRLIAPDRPGIGGSTRLPGRNLLDWPAHMADLAAALDLGSLAVMGWTAPLPALDERRERALGSLAHSGRPPDPDGLAESDTCTVRA